MVGTAFAPPCVHRRRPPSALARECFLTPGARAGPAGYSLRLNALPAGTAPPLRMGAVDLDEPLAESERGIQREESSFPDGGVP